jgi:hypothetical protein
MVDDMLDPGEVSVADGRLTELPALVVTQTVAAPVGNVKWRIGENEIRLKVRMAVIVKRVAVGDLAVDAFIGDFGVGALCFLGFETGVLLLKRVGNNLRKINPRTTCLYSAAGVRRNRERLSAKSKEPAFQRRTCRGAIYCALPIRFGTLSARTSCVVNFALLRIDIPFSLSQR